MLSFGYLISVGDIISTLLILIWRNTICRPHNNIARRQIRSREIYIMWIDFTLSHMYTYEYRDDLDMRHESPGSRISTLITQHHVWMHLMIERNSIGIANALWCGPGNLIDDKSILGGVMDCCRQAHKYWFKPSKLYGATRPYCINIMFK